MGGEDSRNRESELVNRADAGKAKAKMLIYTGGFAFSIYEISNRLASKDYFGACVFGILGIGSAAMLGYQCCEYFSRD